MLVYELFIFLTVKKLFGFNYCGKETPVPPFGLAVFI